MAPNKEIIRRRTAIKKRISTIIFLVTMVALLAAVACGSSSTATVPDQPPPTETPIKGPPAPTETPGPGDPPPEEPAPVAVPAPIEDAAVVFPEVPGGEYTLKITSGLPSGCAQYDDSQVERDGNEFVVNVTNLMPHPSLIVACTEIYGYFDSEVSLGSGLAAGQTYMVTINGGRTVSFAAQDKEGLAMVERESPIANIEVTEADGGYLLSIVSRLPLGSSCSRFSGYQIDLRFAESIQVTVTHRQVPDGYMGPCNNDLPAVLTEISLGSDFADGQTNTVSVNGTEVEFPSDELAMVAVPAPIETASILPPADFGGEYTLNITSGLPSGCAQFNGYEVERTGNDYVVEVTNLMPDPNEPIACTTDYRINEGHFSLEGDLNPGETYTVTINGDLTASFTVQGETATAMVEKESPIESVEVAEADAGYMLTVVSRLPKGSSCSSFNGYYINRRFFDRVEVTVTHFEVSVDNVPCTRDLPVVVTEIQLGDNFESGRTYTVSVNGEDTAFTAR